MNTVSVKQLNLYVKSLMDGDRRLADIYVTGELSNFKNHYSSGHWYFTLKDSDAAIRCVMFRSSTLKVKFKPQDGLQVIIRGRVSVYEKDGQYQLYADEMLPAGDGGISLAIEQIKKKLASEGLFDAENKRPIPKYPRKIAVVTSETGAAVQDIMNIISRRYPVCEIIMCPVSVQGDNAVGDMIDALDRLYELDGIDVVIIGRGGGSIEDLWAFNSENLARKIYESPFPVISAVGHETDFTIADFVADLRAPTPSAAAELAVPNIDDILYTLSSLKNRLTALVLKKYDLEKSKFERLKTSSVLTRPLTLIENPMLKVDRLTEKLNSTVNLEFSNKEKQFIALASKLDSLSPLKVMTRGFCIAEKNSKLVKSISEININDSIDVILNDGKAQCTVSEVTYGEK